MNDDPVRKDRWQLFVHPAFSEPFDRLVAQIEALKRKGAAGYPSHPKTRLLKRILDLIETEIPRDPDSREYNLGNTLGPKYCHWRRAKFLDRFRLFFRYSSAHRSILYVWMNDEDSLRKAGDKNDPYALFARGLQSGNPPDAWDELMKRARPRKRRGRSYAALDLGSLGSYRVSAQSCIIRDAPGRTGKAAARFGRASA